jgi:hypothetical protein
MTGKGDPEKRENTNSEPERAAPDTPTDQSNPTTVRRAYIDELYFSGQMTVADHTTASLELLRDDTIRLSATLPEALQTSKPSPVSLTEMVEKLLHPDVSEPTSSSTSPTSSSRDDERNGRH